MKSDPTVPMHDSVHDMESFMWVVIWICLTRSGPGGHRRKELDPADQSEQAKKIRHIVFCLFDGPISTLSENKTTLFTCPADMENEILPRFHPYFEPLKELVLGWWRKLRMAYKYRIWPTIHDQFLEDLDKTIELLKTTSLSSDAATEAEIKRRKEERRKRSQYLGAKISELGSLGADEIPGSGNEVPQVADPMMVQLYKSTLGPRQSDTSEETDGRASKRTRV